MPDTRRSKATLQTSHLENNTSKNITAQDVRDFCESVHPENVIQAGAYASAPSSNQITGDIYIVSDRPGVIRRWNGSAWVDYAKNWQICLPPTANEPPSSNPATPSLRNGHPVLFFDGSTDEEAVFSAVMPAAYNGGGLTIDTYWVFTATSGSLRVQAAIERIDLSSLDIDADSFASFQSAGGSAPGTAGQVIKVSVALTDGAQIDNLVAGELFRLKIRRDADGTSGTDDIPSDAALRMVLVRET